MKKKTSITQIIRHTIQLGAFILFPGLFITTFAAVRDICTAIIGGSFQISVYADQLLLIAAVFPVTILFGRFFCGYLCSFGAMGDLLWWISSKITKKPIVVSAKADRVIKLLKYFILLLIAAFVWTEAIPMDSTHSPWNIFGMYGTLKGWTDITAWLSVGGLLLLLIIVGDMLIERFFCRYLCPLGAMFAVLSRLRLYRIKKPTEGCGACKLCTRKCSMGISLNTMDIVKSGECIDCHRCVDVCPRENVTATPVPAVAGTVAAIGITGLYYAGTLAAPAMTLDDALLSNSVVATASADGRVYQDGVYTGVGSGFRGNISVEVTVENGLIADITVISFNDDSQFFNRASSSIIPKIISTQSVEVDTVSGATFSSNGIIKAVANALKMELSDSDSNPRPENGRFFDRDSTEWSSSGDSQSRNIQAPELDLSQVADGEYSGTGVGFRGEVKVIVKVENHAITDITIESYQDDQRFFERAKDAVISEIISGQDLNVDTVSGATFSSNGIIEAVANALNVSYSNPNSENPQRGHGPRGNGDWQKPGFRKDGGKPQP